MQSQANARVESVALSPFAGTGYRVCSWRSEVRNTSNHLLLMDISPSLRTFALQPLGPLVTSPTSQAYLLSILRNEEVDVLLLVMLVDDVREVISRVHAPERAQLATHFGFVPSGASLLALTGW